MIRQGLCESRKRWFFPYPTVILLVGIVLTCLIGATPAVATEQKVFISPPEAVQALVNAVSDNNNVELLAILGPEAEDLIYSGDPVADQKRKARFLSVFNEQHHFEHEGDTKAILIIGSQNYPFPIPITQQGNVWIFDTAAGREEILNRRIGRNELCTIKVLQAYIDAQREYAAVDRNSDGYPEFAQQFASSKGRKDGLYWETGKGEQESPFGPLIARATLQGYAGSFKQHQRSEPFHGYYYKILKAQGPHANGGAFDYIVKGNMILGFALVAYPAKYGSSGIMTFMVNHEGDIYEKDLGINSAAVAGAMTLFDPDETWQRCQEVAER
ncbi:MAG: DUF2950 domain-containing protein [Deltaproteobacteria bacterium]|nr:DUF2950 domain-containing protein [Candidatus Anaeroferrophillus wilburensis]MBN2890055.1 DUF2950 domain-containing protein [Deltaproteobacteria bacterium]